jgi:AcrR family transcriptional regulator
MPKSFSNSEKEWIKNKLLEEGYKLFEKYGVQKTSIDQIIRKVGISKGSFYLFYKSKEELFFDILEKLERDFKDNLFKVTFENEKNPKIALRNLFNQIFDFLESTPLLHYVTGRDIEYLLRKLPQEKVTTHMHKDIHQFKDFIIENQNKGILAKKDIMGLTGFLRLIPYLLVHKDEYNDKEFKATKELIIDMIVEYLSAK